ncbi:MAG: hypothetical protein ACLQU2_13555 [Candidatus Binataceae bacterium]
MNWTREVGESLRHLHRHQKVAAPYVPQDLLSQWAEEAGLGYVIDVRVDSSDWRAGGEVDRYLAKQGKTQALPATANARDWLARYFGKQAQSPDAFNALPWWCGAGAPALSDRMRLAVQREILELFARSEFDDWRELKRLQNLPGIGRVAPRARVNFPVIRRATNPDTHFTTLSEEEVVKLYFKPYSIPKETEYTHEKHMGALQEQFEAQRRGEARLVLHRFFQELHNAALAAVAVEKYAVLIGDHPS